MTTEKHDVFISYRREEGHAMARLLERYLRDFGYSPFLDVKSSENGEIEEQLFREIEECDHFICILSPHALDRCVNDDDWVRLEIAKAIELEKNIVTFQMNGFEYPDSLPADIAKLRKRAWVGASIEYFDASFEKLLGFLRANQERGEKENNKRMKENFHNLLETAYQCLGNYRDATRKGEPQEINELSGVLQDAFQSIFRFSERYQHYNAEYVETAKKIIEMYNRFIKYYSAFIDFPVGEARMSTDAQMYAQYAEAEYNGLIEYITKLLHDLEN